MARIKYKLAGVMLKFMGTRPHTTRAGEEIEIGIWLASCATCETGWAETTQPVRGEPILDLGKLTRRCRFCLDRLAHRKLQLQDCEAR